MSAGGYKIDQAGKPVFEIVVFNPEAYYHRAICFEKSGQNDKAVTDLEEALKADPDNELEKNELERLLSR